MKGFVSAFVQMPAIEFATGDIHTLVASSPDRPSNTHNSELWMIHRALGTSDASLIGSDPATRLIEEGFTLADVSVDLQASVQRAFALAQPFFSADLAEKMANRLPLDAGYRPYGVEYSNVESHPDEVGSFTVTRRNDLPSVGALTKEGESLHATMLEVFDGLLPSIAQTTIALVEATEFAGLDDTAQASMSRWSLLQLNYARRRNRLELHQRRARRRVPAYGDDRN